MRYLIIISLVLLLLPDRLLGQEEEFRTVQEMNEYIFSNSDLENITKGYFLDFIPHFLPESREEKLAIFDTLIVDENILISFLSLLEKTDINGSFNVDSVLNPVFNQYYCNNGRNKLLFPIIVGDIDFSYTKEQTFNSAFLGHNSSHPFQRLSEHDIEEENVQIVGLIFDTVVNNNIQIYWDDNTFFSNTNREISSLEINIGGVKYSIPKGVPFDLSDFYDEYSDLAPISFKVIWDDNTFLKKGSKSSAKEEEENEWATLGGVYRWDSIMGKYSDGEDITINTIPRLDAAILWGCNNGKNEAVLDKPYIILSGWGTFTDSKFLNKEMGWPSSIYEVYQSLNNKGFIDSLVGAGFDVVIAKFYPPNASILTNSEQFEQLLININDEKFSNGSYEENIVSGYSAGSMCVRLTLERMEKNHLLDARSPHHHSKLYVSFDGEHGGANVSVGLQKSVNYLRQYYSHPFFAFPNYNIYALNYILNAPLSKELLKYFHTENITSSTPTSGAHPYRKAYLEKYNLYNHTKNTLNPFYPSFTRNISISNGTNHRTDQSSTESYVPYTSMDGKMIFENEGWAPANFPLLFKPIYQRTSVLQLGDPDGNVFKNEMLFWFWWLVRSEKTASNPFLIDNTPGGTTFLLDPNGCQDENVNYQVLKRLEIYSLMFGQLTSWITGVDYVDYKSMYSFTPTFYTHDIKNIHYQSVSGGKRLIYDMREEGLMFQNIEDVGLPNEASDVFGYPHLAHPENHYTNYTPFDAVFAWEDENTVHLQSGKPTWIEKQYVNCSPSFVDVLAGENPKHDRWEQHDSPVREEIRSFILDETDWKIAYVQNRRYGWNANENDPNYVYKADIVSKKKIYAGDSVTQRTNFKPVEIRSNADVKFITCESIHLKPGFHAQSGSSFHAKIDTDKCTYCGTQGMKQGGNKLRNNESYSIPSQSELEIEDEVGIKIYPNPAIEITYIEVDEVETYPYQVYDLMGNLITDGVGRGKTALHLKKGVYIVKLKINTSWYTRKLIMY